MPCLLEAMLHASGRQILWAAHPPVERRVLELVQTATRKFFKKMLDNIAAIIYNSNVNFIAELCNGSTYDSDSYCLGSNPSSAASIASVV